MIVNVVVSANQLKHAPQKLCSDDFEQVFRKSLWVQQAESSFTNWLYDLLFDIVEPQGQTCHVHLMHLQYTVTFTNWRTIVLNLTVW